jgi:hypothetical protein
LKVLREFLGGFDVAQLEPNPRLVERAPGVVARVLSAGDRAHALYLQGRAPTTLELNLERGGWTVAWISVHDGTLLKSESVRAGDGTTALPSPDFADAVALGIHRARLTEAGQP